METLGKKKVSRKIRAGRFFCYAFHIRSLKIPIFHFIFYPSQRHFLLLKQLHFWECQWEVNSFGCLQRLWNVLNCHPTPPPLFQSKQDLAFGMEFDAEKRCLLVKCFSEEAEVPSSLRHSLGCSANSCRMRKNRGPWEVNGPLSLSTSLLPGHGTWAQLSWELGSAPKCVMSLIWMKPFFILQSFMCFSLHAEFFSTEVWFT